MRLASLVVLVIQKWPNSSTVKPRGGGMVNTLYYQYKRTAKNCSDRLREWGEFTRDLLSVQ